MSDKDSTPAEKAKEAARIVADRPRAKTINLEWPIAFDGKEYRKITLARLTAADVAKFQTELESLLASNPDASLRFPLFRDEAGELIPNEVLDALDDDDRYELDRAALDFLPRRFRALAESDSAPAGGENTGPTSAA